MNAAIEAALIQQCIWELEEGILYNYLVKQLDSFGQCEFVFGQDFLF